MAEPKPLLGTAPRPPRDEVIGRTEDVKRLKALLTHKLREDTDVIAFDRRLLRKARLEKRNAGKSWTQEYLAKKAGCSLHSVINAEAGTFVSVQIALELAEALGKPLEELTNLPDTAVRRNLVVLEGLPVVGKTTIAAMLAHDPELKHVFPDGVLWVSLGQNPDLRAEMTAWGRALGDHTIHLENDPRIAGERLAALLRDARMLLLIDDAWKAQDAYAMAVGGARCSVVVTTRIPSIAKELEPAPGQLYHLGVLSEDDGVKVLQSLAGKAIQGFTDAARLKHTHLKACRWHSMSRVDYCDLKQKDLTASEWRPSWRNCKTLHGCFQNECCGTTWCHVR